MEGLTQKQIELNKQEIINLLSSTNREGINKLISYLEKRDYFTAPASTQYHLSVVGGLAQHSLNVYKNMMELYYGTDWWTLSEYTIREQEVEHENIVIVALLHDLCKVDFYKSATRNVKENGSWKEVQVYMVDEKMQVLGHGSKSVIVAQQFIKLYFPEIQAISFHMGLQDDDKTYSGTVSNVYSTVKLALYTHIADLRATFEQDVDSLKSDGNEVNDDDLPF